MSRLEPVDVPVHPHRRPHLSASASVRVVIGLVVALVLAILATLWKGQTVFEYKLGAHLPAAWESKPPAGHRLGERTTARAQGNSFALDKSIATKPQRYDDQHRMALMQ